MIVFPKNIQIVYVHKKFMDLRAKAECSHGWQGRPIYLQHFGHSVEFSPFFELEKPYFCHTICEFVLPEMIDTWDYEADWKLVLESIQEFNTIFADGFYYIPKRAEIEGCIREAITNVRSYYPSGFNAKILIAYHDFKIKAFLADCSKIAGVYSIMTFCIKDLEKIPIEKIIDEALKSENSFR